MASKILGIIPARYASTRLPGKPLVDIGGKTMIQRVFEQARKASVLEKVVVATDDERIQAVVLEFGGEVVMTRPDHPSGTDRCIEVAEQFPDFDAYLNIQGDEPFITPKQIELACAPLIAEKGAFVSTLIHPLVELETYQNPSIIKVVIAKNGRALYFSRAPIPYFRDAGEFSDWHKTQPLYKHLGIYGYTREALQRIGTLEPSGLEKAEKLEQLRWMEDGIPILTTLTTEAAFSIDTPADLEKARAHVKKK